VSERILSSRYLLCSNVTAGSSMTAASTWPCSMAATAVSVSPTPITAARLGSISCFRSRYLRKKSVDEPGALTPTFLPARSLTDRICAVAFGDTTSTSPGKRS